MRGFVHRRAFWSALLVVGVTAALGGCGSSKTITVTAPVTQTVTAPAAQTGAPATSYIDATTLAAQLLQKTQKAIPNVQNGPFTCVGGAPATGTQEEVWHCTDTVTVGVLQAPEGYAVTAYPDGSWYSKPG